MTTFDSLAENYDAGRIGYSNDVYNISSAFGLDPKHRVLDVGCGTGLASCSAHSITAFTSPVSIRPSRCSRRRVARFPDATWI